MAKSTTGERLVDRVKANFPAIAVSTVVIAGATIVISNFLEFGSAGNAQGVSVPQLSEAAVRGEQAFARNCASCHGTNATGSAKGPPLLHDYYNAGHHGDGAFFQAARWGVRQHHWSFGPMPPQPQVSQAEVADIVRYVRELQAANGIQTRPHRMQ
tara:strand:+ start:729 stop:1196 length:468 start_codon:yes stop_codon:yes gene_type:complete